MTEGDFSCGWSNFTKRKMYKHRDFFPSTIIQFQDFLIVQKSVSLFQHLFNIYTSTFVQPLIPSMMQAVELA